MRPTYGWYNGNDVDWDGMGEPIFPDEGAYCPYCGEKLYRIFQKRCGKCKTEIDWEFPADSAGEMQLYGSWKKIAGRWKPDPARGGFSAVYDSNDNEICVRWSERTRYGRTGSLCIPGQVHAESDDPDSPDGLYVVEIQPGVGWWGKLASGDDIFHPYYALPDYCLEGKDE